MAHKDILIVFEIDGEHFEAVGFLDEDESQVSGYTMLERVPNAIGEENWEFLSDWCNKFPAELDQYCLVTNRLSPDMRHSASYFIRRFDHWYQGWSGLGEWWDKDHLVLRRCA